MSAVLERIREKYPAYADTPDAELARAMGNKFPTYLDDAEFRKEYDASMPPGTSVLPSTATIDTGVQERQAGEAARRREVLGGGAPLQVPEGAMRTAAADISETAGDVLESSGQPMVKLMPQYTDEQLDAERQRLRGAAELDQALGTGTEHLEAAAKQARKVGGYQSAANTVNFFTSGQGLASLGLAGLPKAAARVVAGLFTAYMLKQSHDVVGQLEAELSKPEGERDQVRIGELEGALLSSSTFATLSGAGAVHGKGPTITEALDRVKPAGPTVGPLATGEVLQSAAARPEGARPIQARAAEPVGPEAPAQKPVVPETPAEPERQLSAVEETRQAGASTIGQIQEYWRGKTGVVLNRERARELRDLAFPEGILQKQTKGTKGEVPAEEFRQADQTYQRQEEARVQTRQETPEDLQAQLAAELGQEAADPLAPERVTETPPAPAPVEAARQARAEQALKGLREVFQQAPENAPEAETPPPSGQAPAVKVAPGAIVSEILPGERPEPAEAAVSRVEEHIADVAQRGGQAPAKAVKSELVQRLEAAIAKAPSLDEVLKDQTVEGWSKGAKKYKGKRPLAAVYRGEFETSEKPVGIAALVAKGLEKAKTKKITIDIPGDGTFRVWNIKDTLQSILKRAEKVATNAGKAKGVRSGMPAPNALNRPGLAFTEEEWLQPETLTKLQEELRKPDVSAGRRQVLETALDQARRLQGAGPLPPAPAAPRAEGVEAMGSSAPRPSREAAAAARTQRTLRTREQETGELQSDRRDLERQAMTGAPTVGTASKAKWFLGLRRVFAPQTIDEGAAQVAGIIRHALGREYESMRQADTTLHKFRREFDKTPVPRNWTYAPDQGLPRNYEVMRAIDGGETAGLTPAEASFAQVMRRLFDQAIEQVHEVSPNSLRDLYEHYFPRIWKDPERNAGAISRLMSKRPWEGPKSFLKQRTLEYFTDGLEQGLRPVSDNPVDVSLQKLGEMYRFIATRRAMAEAKGAGLRKFVYVYERAPDGWSAVDDPSSSVFAPPTVTVQEAFDAQVRAKTIEFLRQLGIPHERTTKLRGERWGEAHRGTDLIRSKFGGPDFVLWHEAGHVLDYRYPDLREMLPLSGKSPIVKELRALADKRFANRPADQVPESFKRYVRRGPEKMANILDAYVRAPELFQETAPWTWSQFNNWLARHPEVKVPLEDIRPSLTLGSGEAEQFVGGPILLGRWMMPDGAAAVVHNYLTPGLGRYPWFRSLREVSGLANGVQLLGFFHGQFVMNDSFYSGIGLALYDVLNGKPARALKEIVQVPVSPFTSLYRGGKIKAAIERPASAAAQYQTLAKLAVEQNLRAGHGNYDPEFARRWTRAVRELVQAPSTGAAWESLWRAPGAAVELALKPVMNYLVPRMKLGIFARMAERVIADNAEADTVTLRKRLAEAVDATEDRLGQVTYDNLFQSRVVKDAGQLAFRAYGWQLTKYRMMAGGAADWGRAAAALVRGQKPVVTYRMTYLPAMVMGHAILGGILQFALTGRRPQKLTDYLFPESGLVDAYGNPVRLAIADFVKDVAADFRSFPNPNKMGAEWARKLAPFWNAASEMYRNEDFYGTKIFSPGQLGEPGLEHLLKNLKEGAEYLATTALPFSVRAGDRLAQAGGGTAAKVAPFFGLVPAPRYATQTAAETRAAEIMQGMLPKQGRSKESTAHARAVADLVRDLRTGKVNDEGEFERRARAAGVKDQAEVTRIRQRLLWTPMQYQVHRMALDKAMEVFDLGNKAEKMSLAPVLAEKVQRAYDGGKLDAATTKRYVALVMPWYKAAVAARKAPAAQGKQRFSAFAR